MTQVLTDDHVSFAGELADVARTLFRNRVDERPDISIKSDDSPVTPMDKQVEHELRKMIRQRFPEHGILGEEHGAENANADHVWVIDPIDGTLAFIAGVPVYGVLIGLAHERKPVLGVIEHPTTGDRWMGGHSIGTKRNGQLVSVRQCGELGKAFLTTSNTDFMTADERHAFEALKGETQFTLYGASCFAYGLLASGRTDIAVDCGFDIFDALAPAAVVEGAGGKVTDWDGAEIHLGWRGRLAATGDPNLHERTLERLNSTGVLG